MNGRGMGVILGVLAALSTDGRTFCATANDPVADLSRCAVTADRDQRLACYDGLASRYAHIAAPPAPATTRTASAVVATSTPTHSTPSASTTTASVAASATAPPEVSTTESKSEFGLTAVQVRKDTSAPVRLQSIEGVVTGFGQSSLGRPTVRLDNAQSWELNEADPLLSVGDEVTIRRAAMGSFLLMTSTKRMHRVRRIN
jgi:hypothetical protein